MKRNAHWYGTVSLLSLIIGARSLQDLKARWWTTNCQPFRWRRFQAGELCCVRSARVSRVTWMITWTIHGQQRWRISSYPSISIISHCVMMIDDSGYVNSLIHVEDPPFVDDFPRNMIFHLFVNLPQGILSPYELSLRCELQKLMHAACWWRLIWSTVLKRLKQFAGHSCKWWISVEWTQRHHAAAYAVCQWHWHWSIPWVLMIG